MPSLIAQGCDKIKIKSTKEKTCKLASLLRTEFHERHLHFKMFWEAIANCRPQTINSSINQILTVLYQNGYI